MKRFLLRILKFSIISYILLWCMQLSVDYGLRQSKDALYYDWNKANDGDINADIVFFGSSRALKHFDPKIFDTRLDVYSYNLGENGVPFDIQTVKRNVYLNNNTLPKLLVFNVDLGSLAKGKELFKKQQYLPFYTLGNAQCLSEFDDNIWLEYMMPMYKYRENLDLIKMSFLAYLETNKDNVQTYKGYHGSNQSWNGKFEERKKILNGKGFDYSHVDFKDRTLFFRNLLEELNRYNTEVLFVWAPEYIERQELEGELFVKAKKMVEEEIRRFESVRFLDFTNDTICNSKTYFYDSYHLNKNGATIFSNQLADSITKYYKREFKN